MRTPEQIEAIAPLSDRSAQRFPRLSEPQLSVVKRFAATDARTFAPAESLFEPGQQGAPTWFLLAGSVDLFGRDGLDQESALRELDSGQFTGTRRSDRLCRDGARCGAVAHSN